MSTNTGRGALVEEGVDTRRERERGDEHIIDSLRSPEPPDDEMEPSGSGTDGDPVLDARRFCGELLESFGSGAEREYAGTEHLDHRDLVLFIEICR